MNRNKLIMLLTIVLIASGITISLVSYYVSKSSIHHAIVANELPLTADNIYSEIQKDLVRPVFISSMMASDTFLRDWVLEGENGIDRISKYLLEVQNKYGAFISFFVSEKTRNYYYGNGLLKQVKESEPRDKWYFRVREMAHPYEINVDKDLAHQDALTIFVNYRVYGYSQQYIGAVGVGLTVDSVRGVIDGYQERYKRSVYFMAPDGTVMLSGSKEHPSDSNVKQSPGFSRLLPEILRHDSGSYEYKDSGNTRLINVRYIPELKWYLVVEKSEQEATEDIRRALYVNLLISAVVTLIVVTLTHLVLKRYQAQIEQMITTDPLTRLPNRRAFEIVIDILLNERIRSGGNLAVVVLDVDNFKQINDQYGHLGGDYVLADLALTIKSCLRASDFVCRWGGEEFMLLVKDCDETSATLLAEKVRQTLESRPITYNNHPIQITASFGIAIIQPEETMQHAIERADYAMYQAKALGRNRVIFSNFR